MPEKCWCSNEKLKKYSESYSRCDICSTLVSKIDFTEKILNINNEEEDLYGKNYWDNHMKNLSGKNNLDELIDDYLCDRAIYWLKYLMKYKLPGASVAEIGCGIGQFPYLTKAAGYNQIGIELSPAICQYASETLNIKMHCGEIDDIENKYDAILAFDLIEHIIDPVSFMQKLYRHLREDGILCFQTPCYSPDISYKQILDGKYRFKSLLIEQQHIYLFSKQSMEQLLRSVGFKYIYFEPAYFGDNYDMFVFASKLPSEENSNETIIQTLRKQENGRLIIALMQLFEDKKQYERKLVKKEEDGDARLEQIGILTNLLKESETDRSARLEQIETLTKLLEKN